MDDVCDAACATPKGERELGGARPRISRSLREARPTSHPAALRVMPKPLSPGLGRASPADDRSRASASGDRLPSVPLGLLSRAHFQCCTSTPPPSPRLQVTSKVFRQLTKALRFAPCQRCREQLLCSHLPFYIMTTSQSLQLPKHTKLRHVFMSVSIYFHFRLAPYFSCCLPDEVLVIFTIQLSWQLFDLGEEPWLGRPSSPLPRPVLSVLICLFRTWAVSNSRAGPASYGSFCPHQCLERCRFSKIKPKHCDTVRERGDHYSVCPSVQTNCSVSSLNFALHKATKRTCCRCSLFADSTTANRLAR